MTRRLGVLSLGLLRQPGLRRMLALAGWEIRPGPVGVDAIGVWGRRPAARRGMLAARLTRRPLVTLEDAFLRSLRPASSGEPPLGLLIDDLGVHFDAAAPSRLERILAEDPLEGGEAGLALWRKLGLSKLNHWQEGPLPEPGFVLVADQTRGDASIGGGMAGPGTFRAMLAAALAENPGARILVRTHPEVASGRRRGHFGPSDAGGRVGFVDPGLSPAALLPLAARVYAVTSQLGFEAILHGHRPRILGLPFYAGWGLAEETQPCPRRRRHLTQAQLFAGAMLRHPIWYDPFEDRLAGFERVAGILAEQARIWRANAGPSVTLGIRAWKRRPVARFLDGAGGPARHARSEAGAVARARAAGGRVAVWAGHETETLRAACAGAGVGLVRIEDGFLRSLGLGARLVAPASLVLDDLGIHHDPARPSRMEALIEAAAALPEPALARAAALRLAIVEGGVTKYGPGAAEAPSLPAGARVVLVAGQVADDASVRLGATGAVRDNRALLEAARDAEPHAVLVYRPHPDVAAGLRPGAIEARDLADAILPGADPAALLARADGLWTMTSAMGFEALLRGVPVTCLGAPFYAGWGLTRDLGPVPARRRARPALDALVHAALIAYPRYLDPVTGLACTPETLLARLSARDARLGRPSDPAIRLLARAQDRMAPLARLWRL